LPAGQGIKKKIGFVCLIIFQFADICLNFQMYFVGSSDSLTVGALLCEKENDNFAQNNELILFPRKINK